MLNEMKAAVLVRVWEVLIGEKFQGRVVKEPF